MTYPTPNRISSVAVVGAGTIGASWASWFLARGCVVRVSDASPERDAFVRSYVQQSWPALVRIGAARERDPASALDRLTFHAEREEAVAAAEMVQENILERLELKQALPKRIDAALPADWLIASSTSGFKASKLARDMARPNRIAIGHPFNLPHLISLVEIVGGERTDPAAVDWAMAFYRAMGKRPIHIRKEVGRARPGCRGAYGRAPPRVRRSSGHRQFVRDRDIVALRGTPSQNPPSPPVKAHDA